MKSEEIGYLLGQQCAPILAGIKPSNLLIVEPGNQKELSCILRGTGIRSCCLYASGKKDYLLLFEEEKLQKLLREKEVNEYLRKCGYVSNNVKEVLRRLAWRFAEYKKNKQEFPHEMGILFGYPLKDVQGFIENQGKNFKLSGYWKVYDDVDYAGKVFYLYECVKHIVLKLFREGVCISDICRVCRDWKTGEKVQRVLERTRSRV